MMCDSPTIDIRHKSTLSMEEHGAAWGSREQHGASWSSIGHRGAHTEHLTEHLTEHHTEHHPPPPSPYFLVTRKQCDLTNLRTIFCEAHVKIRNADDLRKHLKPAPVTMRCIYLGDDSRAVGALVYIFDVSI